MEKTKNDHTFTVPRYELAGIGTRLIALMIDTFIVGAIIGVIGVRGSEWALGNLIVHLGYHWFFLTQMHGQTPGKMLMGIRVVKTNGNALNTTDVVLRYFGYLINSAVFNIGWLWAAFDSRSQGWHDKLAGTFVIKATRDNKRVFVGEKSKNDDDMLYI
ncbi:MAG: RDD family protein [Aggregatilineales bacterium]